MQSFVLSNCPGVGNVAVASDRQTFNGPAPKYHIRSLNYAEINIYIYMYRYIYALTCSATLVSELCKLEVPASSPSATEKRQRAIKACATRLVL